MTQSKINATEAQKLVEQKRFKWLMKEDLGCELNKLMGDEDIQEMVNNITSEDGSPYIDVTIYETTANETLKELGQTFINLTLCPSTTWNILFWNLSTKADLKTIIMTVNRIIHKIEEKGGDDSYIETAAREVLSRTGNVSGLDFQRIADLGVGNLEEGFKHSDYDEVHRLSNHPVHIIDDQGNLNPSAFIPFCEFGGNITTMGAKINNLSIPVCNAFKPIVFNQQYCYRVDLEKYNTDTDLNQRMKNLKEGLLLWIDLNKDRQVKEHRERDDSKTYKSFSAILRKEKKGDDPTIHINTIGF